MQRQTMTRGHCGGIFDWIFLHSSVPNVFLYFGTVWSSFVDFRGVMKAQGSKKLRSERDVHSLKQINPQN
jgi:hypothetical protein